MGFHGHQIKIMSQAQQHLYLKDLFSLFLPQRPVLCALSIFRLLLFLLGALPAPLQWREGFTISHPKLTGKCFSKIETCNKISYRVWIKVLIRSAWSPGIVSCIHIWLKKSANKVALSKCSTIKVCTTHWRFDKTWCGFEPRIFAAVSLSSFSFLGLIDSRDEAKTDKPSSDIGLLLWGGKKIKKEDYEFWIICYTCSAVLSSPLACFRWWLAFALA